MDHRSLAWFLSEELRLRQRSLQAQNFERKRAAISKEDDARGKGICINAVVVGTTSEKEERKGFQGSVTTCIAAWAVSWHALGTAEICVSSNRLPRASTLSDIWLAEPVRTDRSVSMQGRV